MLRALRISPSDSVTKLSIPSGVTLTLMRGAGEKGRGSERREGDRRGSIGIRDYIVTPIPSIRNAYVSING